MLFSPSPATTIDSTPGRWNPRTGKARGATQRKVYGKRKADAPRAVFDPKSPAKALEHVVLDALDCIQAKLAEVKIDDPPTAQEKEEPVEQEISSVHGLSTTDDLPTPTPESQNEETSTGPSPATTTPKRPTRYETMVEVRISPRDINLKHRNKPIEAKENATESNKRTTRKKKPTPRLSSGCVQDEKLNNYVRAVLNESLSPVAAEGVQKFSSWAARAGNVFHVVKLAEGSYGEVYKLRLREEVCKKEMSKSKLERLRAYGDGVFKVVPLRARSGPGSKKFTSIEEIVSEVKLLKYLDPIPGFARFSEIHVVQGRFPETFQDAWDHYKKTKDDCLNPNPASKRAYPDTQLWAIVEMDDAGCELEKFSWSSIFQIYDIFWGVAMALARAEEYALFEHRDLHLGNICIKTTRSDGRMDPPTDLDIIRQSSTSGFGLSTLETTIIDYSLSRAQLRASEDSDEFADVASTDLDKKQIFDAIGRDDDETLLRNTYRQMRAQLYQGNPLDTEKTPNIPGIWAEYAPRTNLIWLLFILKSLLKNRKNQATQPTPSRKPLAHCSPNKNVESKPAAKSEKKGDKPLARTTSTIEAQKQVARLKTTLEDRLTAVLELLDLEHGHEDMCCAADLVAYAIDLQWLDPEDFF